MISDKLKNIPQNPGCYLFKNDKEQIIYVGMSKFLPKRVSSYFQKNHTGKTKTLVENIVDVFHKGFVDYLCVGEQEHVRRSFNTTSNKQLVLHVVAPVDERIAL